MTKQNDDDLGAVADDVAEKQDKPLSELTPDEIVERLAKLPELEYEQTRIEAAEALGIGRIAVLDNLVKKARKDNDQTSGQGRTVNLYQPEPWSKPVDGAEVLNEASDAIKRHMIIRAVDADASALWALHSHVYESFNHTPRFLITAPDAECGKTVLMAHMIGNMITKPQSVELLKSAPFFRLAEAFKPSFLIDEADVFLNADADLIAAVNNGWEPHGGVLRCVGDDYEVKQFSTHCPVVMAGIEMHKHLPTTTISRSIIVHLERAAFDEIDADNIYDKRKHQKYIRDIGRKMARWCLDNRTEIASIDPAMPDSVRNRMADKWRPLLAVATVAGGDWVKRTESAMFGQVDMSEPSKALRLIEDALSVIADGDKGIWTADLIRKLSKIEEAPWAEYNFRDRDEKNIKDRQIARLLKGYGIHPEDIRFGEIKRKGYKTAKLQNVASRYLRKESQELSATARQTSNSNNYSDTVSATFAADKNTSATEKTPIRDTKPSDSNGCRVVADNYPTPQEIHAQNWRDRIK